MRHYERDARGRQSERASAEPLIDQRVIIIIIMKQTLMLIAAVVSREVFWTRIEELLDNVNQGLDNAQTYIAEEIKPQIETLESKSTDYIQTSTEMQKVIDEQLVGKVDWSESWQSIGKQVNQIDWQSFSDQIRSKDNKGLIDWTFVDEQIEFIGQQVDFVNSSIEKVNDSIDWDTINKNVDEINNHVNSIDWTQISKHVDDVSNNVRRSDVDWETKIDNVAKAVNESVLAMADVLKPTVQVPEIIN